MTKSLDSDGGGNTTRSRAERALLAHVQSSVGAGHGPKDAIPDGIASEAVAEAIEPVEE